MGINVAFKPSSIELVSINKSFGTQHVLKDVDLEIDAGQFISLLGPSGCGKSTLLRIIAGLVQQDSGSVQIGGHCVDHLLPRQRNTAMVFQSYALYPHMTVRENIATPLLMDQTRIWQRLPLLGRFSRSRSKVCVQIDETVVRLAQSLKIDHLLDRKPSQLSGGQRQRVALARAMVREPSAFLMDEPLSNLDARLRVEVRDELAALHARIGATFIFVTHDQSEAMSLSDRIAVMNQGKIEQIGTPRALYDDPATKFVAGFIGTPRINFFPCGALGPTPAGVDSFGVRPESIVVVEGGPERKGDFLTVPARLMRVEHQGAELICWFANESMPEPVCARIFMGRGTPPLDQLRESCLLISPSDLLAFDSDGRRVRY
jgi:multiple sugar transport system ATP-binding protein